MRDIDMLHTMHVGNNMSPDKFYKKKNKMCIC